MVGNHKQSLCFVLERYPEIGISGGVYLATGPKQLANTSKIPTRLFFTVWYFKQSVLETFNPLVRLL